METKSPTGMAGTLFLLLALKGLAIEPGEVAGPVELESLDGRRVVMRNYSEHLATAVLFLSARCPETERVLGAISGINKQYRLRDVLLVGIFRRTEESGEEVRAFAQRSGLIFPVYRDRAGTASRGFGAQVTPEAFLLDRDGKLLYRGSIGALQDAISRLVAGRPVEASRSPARGTPMDQPLPRREPADPYGSIWFASELVFEKIPGAPAHHASSIAEAANGDLVVVWYGGSYESADDQALYLARRRKGERSWSRPDILLRDPVFPPGNAVVFRDGLNRLWIVWARMEAERPLRRGGGWDRCRLMYRISADHGASWSEDRELVDTVGWLPRNPPITLSSGELLLPLAGRVGSFFLRTRDQGRTWERSAVIAGGGQPAMIQREDGTLLALMRARPRILWSESGDGGLGWTPAKPTALKNPGSGISATRLRNGRLVLVFNDSESDRTPLNIARSVDGGRSWEPPLTLESNPGEYSYPCVIQDSAGTIHITYTFRRYTIKHVELNEEWLTRPERPN